MRERLSRRSLLQRAVWASAGPAAVLFTGGRGRAATVADSGPTAAETFGLLKRGKKIPVIYDTDIGGDIDDTWALAMLLMCPELDVRLVVSDSGNDVYRARILAKMLQTVGRTDIPVGIGAQKADKPGPQSDWVGDYRLSQYPGKVYEDGVGATIETIMDSPDPITLVCVGPVPNVSAALDREPGIAKRARFVGMHGSVRRGYGNRPKPAAEYNVRAAPKALQAVFAAPWDITITPLDTCGIVHLKGSKYQKVHQCQQPGTQALMENYRVWAKHQDPSGKRIDPAKRSSTLFDTVAVYLAYSEDLTVMEELPIRVDDKGLTVIDKNARPVHCAMRWKDLGVFEDHLVERLT